MKVQINQTLFLIAWFFLQIEFLAVSWYPKALYLVAMVDHGQLRSILLVELSLMLFVLMRILFQFFFSWNRRGNSPTDYNIEKKVLQAYKLKGVRSRNKKKDTKKIKKITQGLLAMKTWGS
jgi:hypothetical protein